MKVRDIIKILDAKLVTGEQNLDTDVIFGCGSDLMSDVMAYVKENVVLLTGLVSPQVIRTAEMMDIKVIAFVRGKSPSSIIIELAAEKGITLMMTNNPMFTACGKLYNSGLTGRCIWD